ncbi:MAG: RES family NAD+ phosphorylase [Steroidobacteraceae bacterium]
MRRSSRSRGTISLYRIGDPRGAFPIFDAKGSTLYPGRWNTSASPMIYCSEHYSTAMLEKLVYGNGQLPPNQHFIEITISNGVTYEMFNTAAVPDWYLASMATSKPYGESWQQQQRSLLLIVPSIVARPEHNFLLNPQHPEFPQVATRLHQPIWWDQRLFAP